MVNTNLPPIEDACTLNLVNVVDELQLNLDYSCSSMSPLLSRVENSQGCLFIRPLYKRVQVVWIYLGSSCFVWTSRNDKRTKQRDEPIASH